MTKPFTHKNEAASPVVGVMLLLIITVLIAAVVSSYVGSLSDTKTRPPQLILSPEIYRNDTALSMNMKVLSAGNGIATRDLRVITDWKALDSSGGSTSTISGGGVSGKLSPSGPAYPIGHGAGVREDPVTSGQLLDDFGEYMLLGGTLMYIYCDSTNEDGCLQLLGTGWKNLEEGDLVNLKIVHMPSQSTIVDQEIMVRSLS